jgi:glycosyltransferase involved in cell wall biosynthesis
LTGHCAYPMDCPRHREGCGSCPDLGRLPGVWIDRTAQERRRKRQLLESARPSLVCVSSWVQRQVEASGLGSLDSTVIPCGIADTTPGAESREQIRDRLGWPRDKLVYLYISSGGLNGSVYKDPETLIGAALELQRTGQHHDKLIVTAGGRRRIHPSLEGLIRQYDHIASGIEHFYAAADVFVYPTKVETVGLVLLEAARAGLPAITVDAGGCPEIVRDGETGLIIPARDARSLASAMCRIQALDRAELGRQARRRFERLYTLDKMVGAYRQLFESVITRRAAALPGAHRQL